MEELRKLLPGIQKIVYLNYGRTGPLLVPSARLIQSLYEEAIEPFQFHREEWGAHLENTRSEIAELIHATKDEIAFTTSTSSGLSLIAASIQWKEGDRVFYPADEYLSNRFVWNNLEEKGVISESIQPVKNIPFSQQLEERDLSQVKLVSVSAVSFWDGRRHDIEKIAKICHAKGILLAVDAIQALGAIPIDVKKWNCDFLASGGQKWLFGPIGTGFVYFKKSIISQLTVPQMGWGSIQPLTDIQARTYTFADGAKRFEPSYFDIPAFAGLGESIRILKKIGWEKIHTRITQLVDKTQKELTTLGYHPLSKGPQSGIIAFEHPEAEAIAKKLESHKIYITQRGKRLRICIHAPVTEPEIEVFLSKLERP